MDYSIIICTYNTDERILRRCLESVAALDRKGLETEVILADNNSVIPVESLGFVRQCFSKIPNMKGILVSQQGVKYARMEAIEKAKGKYIVYIDADNEPETDYLQQLKKLNVQFEQVGAWGPGNVTVQFIDEVDKSLESYARTAFQERHDLTLKTANLNEWQPCYPFGTGLCMISTVLKEYVALAKQGKFTSEGRKGKKLSSGEDTQMVMLCIKNGYHAGVSPALKLNHLISKERANKEYLKKLIFGTAVCYEPSLLQVFPERKKIVEERMISPFSFSRQAAQKLAASKLGAPRVYYDAINFIGCQAGVYQALDKPLPRVVKKMIGNMKLE
jgi:glycosyltransferase involved in cell wall biosynthesis